MSFNPEDPSHTYLVPSDVLGPCHVDHNTYERLYRRSIEDPNSFWAEQAEAFLDWEQKWEKVSEVDYFTANIKWFIGGKLNVSVNCLDRHLIERHDQTALIWEGNQPGEMRSFTYQELHEYVCRIANVLKKLGVQRGDRVAIYMPMVPELAASMLACARIGAVHSVVFGGFSSESLKDRILDSQCSLVITSNEGLRGAKKIPLKSIVDEALKGVDCVRHVLVHQRTESGFNFVTGRDRLLSEELKDVPVDCPAEVMDSEDPLFILYTSGSTGKPKGVLHTQAGYLLYTAITHRYVFDYRDGDIYCCAADCGWITGHSYVVYGPLCNGATTVMFESIPTYPDAGRYWDLIQRHRINIFYTAPTAIRAVAKEGEHLPDKYDLSSLRILGTVGEPINHDAWMWYYQKVGRGRCPIVDTYWQTETGGILITPLPGVTALKPGSATRPFFGIQPCLVDEAGREIQGNDVKGRLCIKASWPGQMRTVYGDHDRFRETYFSQFPGLYFTGDASIRDEDGYYWVTGRVDDVLNISGHRLGTAEVESAIVQSGSVAEAAVVGMPHDIKGHAIYAFCVLREGVQASKQVEDNIRSTVREKIAAFAAPEIIQVVPGLPKTRSGKIMRRILRKIAEGERHEFGDVTTLAEPSVVEEIVREAEKIRPTGA